MAILIKGKRVNLRQLRKSDAKSLYQNAKDFEIAKYTRLPHPYKLGNATSYIKENKLKLRKKTDYSLGIELKETSQIIGMISLMKVDKKNKNAELGYWLGKKYWGQGLMSEALQLILNFGFKKLRLERIHAGVMHPNKPSLKVLKKAGFKYEGRHRREFLRHGKWLDALMHSLLRDEYKPVKIKPFRKLAGKRKP